MVATGEERTRGITRQAGRAPAGAHGSPVDWRCADIVWFVRPSGAQDCPHRLPRVRSSPVATFVRASGAAGGLQETEMRPARRSQRSKNWQICSLDSTVGGCCSRLVMATRPS